VDPSEVTGLSVNDSSHYPSGTEGSFHPSTEYGTMLMAGGTIEPHYDAFGQIDYYNNTLSVNYWAPSDSFLPTWQLAGILTITQRLYPPSPPPPPPPP